MFRTAPRIARLMMAGSVALLTASPALSLTRADQPVQSWPAIRGMDVATLLEHAQEMPTSDVAVDDQPYCASHAEIHETLKSDFNEMRVDDSGHAGAELWGSEQMGTWTLVAPREDAISCIIASGIGYSQQRDVEIYYQTAGLK